MPSRYNLIRSGWLARHKYLTLLLALLLLFFGYPVAHESAAAEVLYDILVAVVYLVALGGVFTLWRHRLVAVVLGVPAVAGGLAGYAFPRQSHAVIEQAFHIIAPVFLIFAVAVALQGIFRAKRISSESVYGAFACYLLIGLAFGHLYCLVVASSPRAFGGPGAAEMLSNPKTQHAVLTYFSFMTLTTVGYGDITPASPMARNLAWIEAIVGQFYIAGLVAELIGLKVATTVLEAGEKGG